MILASGLFEPLASHPAEASLILPTDAMKLTDLDFTTVRMLSIDGTTVTAVLEQNIVLEFKFNSVAELSREFALWIGPANDISSYQIGDLDEWDFRSRFEN
jgi:hypothetical protein